MPLLDADMLYFRAPMPPLPIIFFRYDFFTFFSMFFAPLMRYFFDAAIIFRRFISLPLIIISSRFILLMMLMLMPLLCCAFR